jgi:uncharacterized membrane protein YdjX (TVP38/TMEM64 family)
MMVILSGPIFGSIALGLTMSVISSMMGGSICFFMSKFVGEEILSKQAPEKFAWLKKKV